jgi:nitrate reductase NapE component
MNRDTNDKASAADARKKAEQKTAFRLALIFGSLIAVMIVGMLVFDVYSEKITEAGYKAPADAAER